LTNSKLQHSNNQKPIFFYADNTGTVASQVAAYGQQLDREMAGYVLEDTRLSTLQRKLSKVRIFKKSMAYITAFLVPVNIVG
jgi:hypothetical protein